MTLHLGASVWGYFAGRDSAAWPSVADAVRAIRAVDPRLGVEVWATRGSEDPDPGLVEESDIAAAVRGAPFVSVHARLGLWSWDPAGIRREIDFAARIGARTVVVHPATLGLEDETRVPDVPEIRRLIGYARRSGVWIALENITDSMRALDFALEISEDAALGVCIDVGHATLSRDAGRRPVRAYIERYRDRLVHLHLHDTLGEHDDHAVPGRGVIDWGDLARVLADVGFAGTAVVETVPGRQAGLLERPDDAIREATRFLSALG